MPTAEQQRLYEVLLLLGENPQPRGSVKLKGRNESAAYRVRVGRYRIIYEVQPARHRVLILAIDKRGRVYDR